MAKSKGIKDYEWDFIETIVGLLYDALHEKNKEAADYYVEEFLQIGERFFNFRVNPIQMSQTTETADMLELEKEKDAEKLAAQTMKQESTGQEFQK